jgi:hypothetical protein
MPVWVRVKVKALELVSALTLALTQTGFFTLALTD